MCVERLHYCCYSYLHEHEGKRFVSWNSRINAKFWTQRLTSWGWMWTRKSTLNHYILLKIQYSNSLWKEASRFSVFVWSTIKKLQILSVLKKTWLLQHFMRIQCYWVERLKGCTNMATIFSLRNEANRMEIRLMK